MKNSSPSLFFYPMCRKQLSWFLFFFHIGIGWLHAVESQNIMKIHDVTAAPGDTITIALEIMNDEQFVGFNLDIHMPEGFQYVEGTGTLFRRVDHSFSFVIREGNIARIIAFSLSNTPFTDHDGIIFSFDVLTPEDPGNHELLIVNPVLGSFDAQNILTGSINGVVKLTANLELLASPAEGGTVHGAGSYPVDELVELTAVPESDWVLHHWKDMTGNVISEDAIFDYVMPAANVTLTAHFEKIRYTLTFVITDFDTDSIIPDAVVTLNGVTHHWGEYVFEDLQPGTYEYVISHEDYLPANGSIDIIDNDVTEEIALIFDDEQTRLQENETLKLIIKPDYRGKIIYIESNTILRKILLVNLQGQIMYDVAVKDVRHEINALAFCKGIYILYVNTEMGITAHKLRL